MQLWQQIKTDDKVKNIFLENIRSDMRINIMYIKLEKVMMGVKACYEKGIEQVDR